MSAARSIPFSRNAARVEPRCLARVWWTCWTPACTARIVVDTDPDTEAVLRWGAGGTLDQEVRSPPGRHHVFSLANLPARGAIRYRIHAGASQTPDYTFNRPPAKNSVIRLGIYGYVRGGHAIHAKLVENMLSEPLDLVVRNGERHSCPIRQPAGPDRVDRSTTGDLE